MTTPFQKRVKERLDALAKSDPRQRARASWRHWDANEVRKELRADFGTIAGFQSVGELRELLTAKDVTIKAVADKFAEIGPSWKASAPGDFADWESDWNVFRDRYGTAKVKAEAEIAAVKTAGATSLLGLVVDDYKLPTADVGYKAILGALSKEPGNVQRGDFQDLAARIEKASKALGAKPPDYSNLPQPAKGKDLDVTIYNATDTTLFKHPYPFIYAGAGLLAVLALRKLLK